jgi:hypothetical protein
MNNISFINSSNELTTAQNIQQQISQKEFEIQLVDINSRYSSSQDSSYYYYNPQKKYILDMEIQNLKKQRDAHLINALTYALADAESEMNFSIPFSTAAVSISNICSFIRRYNIKLNITLQLMLKISSISSRISTRLNSSQLKQEITNLKIQLNIL